MLETVGNNVKFTANTAVNQAFQPGGGSSKHFPA